MVVRSRSTETLFLTFWKMASPVIENVLKWITWNHYTPENFRNIERIFSIIKVIQKRTRQTGPSDQLYTNLNAPQELAWV